MDLSGFSNYLSRGGIRGVSYYVAVMNYLNKHITFSYESLMSFVDELLDKHTKRSTINRYLSVIKSYGRYKQWDWVEQITKLKEIETPKIGLLSNEEVEEFLLVPCPPRTPIESWNSWTLFYSIIAYTGMRPRECAQLDVESIDFNSNNFLLWETKTSVPRRVPIPRIIKSELVAHCKNRTGLLFPVKRDDAVNVVMCAQTWRRHFLRRIGIMNLHRKYLKPYSFRHSFATSMLSEDVREVKVMKILGHKNIKTTMRYTHLINKDIQAVINEHPNAKKNTSSKELIKEQTKVAEKMGLLERADVTYTITPTGFAVSLVQFLLCFLKFSDTFFSGHLFHI